MTTAPRRVRSIDLENPFIESFEGMCEVLLVRHGEQKFFENIPLGQAYNAPLSELGGQLGAKIATVADPQTGLSLRSRLFYDGSNSKVIVALDVLYGVKTLEPNRAVRLRN